MDTLVVYSAQYSPRLKYVLDWLFKERLHLEYSITSDKQQLKDNTCHVVYGAVLPNSLCIPDHGLLWQKGNEKCRPKTGAYNELPVIFAAEGNEYTFNFDLFSAIFFLLSRYEEYDSFTPDKHGRYPAAGSILYKHGWLMRPIVDEWVYAFRKKLQTATGETIAAASFLYQPTYDIDIAYAHIYKGLARIAGAYLRAIIKMDVMQISERIQVMKKKQKDPYDSFRWLRQLHKQFDYKPVYFVLSADKTTAFDKNIHPMHPAMTRVIKNMAKEGEIGIHPSYYSEQKELLQQEKKVLEQLSGTDINISRQHYIRMMMPGTYRLLLENNITNDYSMGYGSHLGFRAGTGNSFLWYDLEKEEITRLRIHPFCFMDTTAHYEAKLSPAQAFEKLEEMSNLLMQTGSTLVTIFHNFSLGTSNEWKGWRQGYEHFLQGKSHLSALKEYNV